MIGVLPLDSAEDFLTAAQLGAATLPIRFAYVPFDDGAAVNDAVSWDGQTLTVRQAVDVTAKGDVVARLLVLA